MAPSTASHMDAWNRSLKVLVSPLPILHQNASYCAPMLTPKARIFNMLKNSPFPEKKNKYKMVNENNESQQDDYAGSHTVDILLSPSPPPKRENIQTQLPVKAGKVCYSEFN